MNQNKQELTDLIQKEISASNVIGSKLKKVGDFLYRTVKQSPDAHILLAGYIATYFIPELENMRFLFGFFACYFRTLRSA